MTRRSLIGLIAAVFAPKPAMAALGGPAAKLAALAESGISIRFTRNIMNGRINIFYGPALMPSKYSVRIQS